MISEQRYEFLHPVVWRDFNVVLIIALGFE